MLPGVYSDVVMGDKAGESTWSFLLLLLLSCIWRTASDAGDVESARCRVRCLAHLKHKLGGPGGDWAKQHITFERCFTDKACTACVRPCGQPYIGVVHCLQLCQIGETDCEESCNFLRHLRTVRPGSCPPVVQVLEPSPACTEACHHDKDCEGTRKCCPHTCGRACVSPIQLYTGVPDIPLVLRVLEKMPAGTVEITWLPSLSNSSVPILYMVQGRHNVGQHVSALHMSDWTQLAQTTSTTALLRDVGPGRWYEFRVAAVGINGTQGFSPPTNAFRLSKEPGAPGPPQNLTEGQTVIRDNKIYLTVHWDPPGASDLPIIRYKIFWHKRLKSGSFGDDEFKEYKKVVSGDTLQYELSELEPDTTYLIQIQAISAYGDNKLKSERASIYTTTYAFEQNIEPDTGARQLTTTELLYFQVVPTAILDIESLVTLPELSDLELGEPFFQNGLLKINITWKKQKEEDKVNIQWAADVCISDGFDSESVVKSISASTTALYFILYDLRFDCRYMVKLQPVSSSGQVGPVANLSFQTPSCGDVEVIGDVTPDCPTHIPSLPEKPPDLHHSFLIMQTNITARISWKHPASDVPITGYRVVWGQATIADPEDLDAQPVIEEETALTKVLSKDTTTFNIEHLHEATSYMVQVEAMSQEGSGKTAIRHFTTPVLQPQPVAGPPYKIENDSKRRGSKAEVFTEAQPYTQTNWPVINIAEASRDKSLASTNPSKLCIIFTAVLLVLLT